jgi:hypothetical protein
MQHRIETNIDVTNAEEVKRCLSSVCRRIGATDYEAAVDVDDNFSDKLVVVVKGNGATLRDVAYALDLFGALN